MGLLAATRLHNGKLINDRSYKYGGKLIKRERELHEDFKQQWRVVNALRAKGEEAVPAPTRDHVSDPPNYYQHRYQSAGPMTVMAKKAGEVGFQRKRDYERAHPPELITVTLSKYGILRAARLPDTGRHRANLEAALKQLCKPVFGPRLELPPLLDSWKHVAAGEYELRVTTSWSQPSWLKVDLPLPILSPAALAMYLYLHEMGLLKGGEEEKKKKLSVDDYARQWQSNPKRRVSLNSLAKVLGVADGGPAYRWRAIKRAGEILNAYFAKQGLPVCIKLVPFDRGRTVQFMLDNPQWETNATAPKQRERRVRLQRTRISQPSDMLTIEETYAKILLSKPADDDEEVA